MRGKLFVSLLVFFTAVFTGCATIQTDWKTDAGNIEKDIAASKKDGVIVFTASDSNDVCKKLTEDVFTEKFFSEASKSFLLYNVDIVKNESLMSSKELEKNYILFSQYNILEVPHLCVLNKDGDAYHSELIPFEITTPESFIKYLKEIQRKGEKVSALKTKIEKVQGSDKIKAIDEFFNSVYFVDSEKYRQFFEEGIKSDPANKSGLTGKFILAKTQLNIDELLLQKKYGEAIEEFTTILNSKILNAEESQSVWCNIAYIAALSQTYSKPEIIVFLENALNAAPSSLRANDIKADIEYLRKK